MFGTRPRAAPYISLRHAREGPIGGLGRLPVGWEGEHTASIRVLAVDSSDERPWLTAEFGFDEKAEGEFIGLAIGPFLSAPKDAVAALAAEVTLAAWDNVSAALLVMREWRHAGQFMGQTNRGLALGPAPQVRVVAHQVTGKGRVVQPFLLARRAAAAPGNLTFTLRGVTFGNLYEHPRWLWP